MNHSIYLPTIRFGMAGFVALIVTFLLFFLMQYLIAKTGNNELNHTETVYFLEFIRLIDDTEEILPPDQIITPKPVDPPPDVIMDEWDEIDSTGASMRISQNEGIYMPLDDNLLSASINTELISIVEMQPVYPRVAISKNIEGFVIVEFTVSKSGTTESIRVIEAKPDNVFEKSAIKAASKFKYRPRIVDGKAQVVTGMRKLFTFELKD